MIKYNSGLYGYSIEHKIEYFSGSDTESNFLRRIKFEDKDWYYHNNKIVYKRNNNGHRCDLEIDDLKDDYFLTIGCSNSEGIGLHFEHTYSHLISKKLKIKNYNLSLGGSGWDLLCYNLTTFLNLNIKKPNFILIQWPGYYRYYEIDPENENKLFTFVPNNIENLDFLLGDVFKNSQVNSRDQLLNLIKKLEIDYFEYTIGSAGNKEFDIFYSLPWLDYGRDHHPGIKSNLMWSWMIINELKNQKII